MATKKTGESADIRYDEFVKKVRPDPKLNDQVSILHGYVGEGVTDDSIRLYSDETLNEYIDVAKSDILYSVPNEDSTLGGSKLWIKQSADVKYSEGNSFAEGDMYDDYMGNMYDSDYGTMGPGAATQICTIQPGTLLTRNIVCRPTRFICPTPVSRLVICTLPRTINNCPTVTILTRNGCPQPSLVDGCPSQWGCTIAGGTKVINPGVVRPNEFGGGDVYDDYMQNMYDDGGQTNFGPTNTVACTVINTSPAICRFTRVTLQPNCFITIRQDCLRTINPRQCPITCGYRTRQILTLRCPIRTIACATDFTRPIYSVACATDITIPNPGKVQFTNPGGIAGMYEGVGADYNGADYGYGDMYDGYMQNDYVDESMGADAAAHIPPPTSPGLCQPLITIPVQVCGGITQVWNTRCCRTQPWDPRCRITQPWDLRCGVTRPWNTRCRITKPWGCFTPPNTLNHCEVKHPNI